MKGLILVLCALLWMPSVAGLLPVPNDRPKVSRDWKPALDSVWQGVKRRNVDPWTTGLIHRPKSESPGDAVSEGVGYGMLLALYSGDQEYFNRIWDAGERYMWNGRFYDWRANSSGAVIARGAATDADEDIALCLIFADRLVRDSIWSAHASPKGATYAQRAQAILNSMWSENMITSNNNVAPGAGWGGDDFVNPGYFAPAWYRIFADFDSNSNHRWDLVINKCYSILESNPGAALGLGPDWMATSGSFYSGSLGYNPYFNGRAMHKDGIRILWRLAVDAIWFDAASAKAFLQKSLTFINGKGGPSAANFYDMQGALHPAADTWTFNGNASTRPRREHSHLTLGMWSTVAMAVGTDSERNAYSDAMAGFYQPNATYFGLATDPSGNAEDTAHNEMYFDQFLAWFGTSLMAGAFSNIIDDLDHPPVPVYKQVQPIAKPLRIVVQGNVLLIPGSAVTSNPTLWSLKGTRLAVGYTRATGSEISLQGISAGLYLVKLGEQSGWVNVR